jgi:2-C-methyl-D-erythritol 2,4-cyclodiphosphate synthase
MLLPELRVGQGHDTHRTVTGRPLILGGVRIEPAEFGLDGHSDADVLLHAITDALLGAAGLGDIGEWFSNTDPRWKGADSAELLRSVLTAVHKDRWRILNLDCTIHAERPKLSVWKPIIGSRLAQLLSLTPNQINVKAKSGEQVGPVGRGEAIMADAVVLLVRSSEN